MYHCSHDHRGYSHGYSSRYDVGLGAGLGFGLGVGYGAGLGLGLGLGYGRYDPYLLRSPYSLTDTYYGLSPYGYPYGGFYRGPY